MVLSLRNFTVPPFAVIRTEKTISEQPEKGDLSLDANPHWPEELIQMSDKFLRMSEVRRRVPLSRSQIYLLMSRNEFPKPVSLGARAVGFLESEVDAWITARVAAFRQEKSA
jgi:prophage regulatory protein